MGGNIILERTRENNFDMLRVISAFSVILIHVTSSFLKYNDSGVPTNGLFHLMLLNHIGRFAVPCFLMLTGAFILADSRNEDYRYFYKKEWKSIGISGVVICFVYVIYKIMRLVLSTLVLHKQGIDTLLPNIIQVLESLLRGEPSVHIWYLFVLIGVYIAVPFVIRLASCLCREGVNLYGKITLIFLILSSISYITSEHELIWDIGV